MMRFTFYSTFIAMMLFSHFVSAGDSKVQFKGATLKGEVPAGWELVEKDSAEPCLRKVVLKDGTEKMIELKSFYLKPLADGKTSFAVKDPFYKKQGEVYVPSLEREIEEQNKALLNTEKEVGQSLEALKQLLLTLPVSEPQKEESS